MFSKKERINTERFTEIIQLGNTIRSTALYIKFIPGEQKRFAVVVPKKLEKGAVGRHLLKRRIAASLKKHTDLFPNADYIVFASEGIKGAQGATLDVIIQELAAKVAS